MCSDRVRRVVGKFNKNITLPSCLGLKSAAVTTHAAGQASPRSQLRKEMWLIGDKYDWLAKKSTWELGQLNDWRRLSVSITGGGDFASALLFVTVSPMQCMTSSSVVLQLSQHWRLRLISHINTRYDWNKSFSFIDGTGLSYHLSPAFSTQCSTLSADGIFVFRFYRLCLVCHRL